MSQVRMKNVAFICMYKYLNEPSWKIETLDHDSKPLFHPNLHKNHELPEKCEKVKFGQ